MEGPKFFDRALQLANIIFELVCHVFAYVLRNIKVKALRLSANYRHPGLKFGSLHIGGQAPFKARFQPVLKGGYVFRGPVGG